MDRIHIEQAIARAKVRRAAYMRDIFRRHAFKGTGGLTLLFAAAALLRFAGHHST